MLCLFKIYNILTLHKVKKIFSRLSHDITYVSFWKLFALDIDIDSTV